MMKTLKGSLAKTFVAAAVLGLQGSYAATSFTNGSFESPGGVAANKFLMLTNEDTRLTGWTVGGTIGLLNGTYAEAGLDFPPVDGSYHLVFNLNDAWPGSWISQTFDTQYGKEYIVSFNIGRSGDGFANMAITATVRTGLGTLITNVMVFAPSHGYSTKQCFSFIAGSAQTTLEFMDSSNGSTGVDLELDNIEVALNVPKVKIEVSQVRISWTTVPNRSYQVQYTEDGGSANWVNLGSPIKATGTSLAVTDAASDSLRKLYRVQVVQ